MYRIIIVIVDADMLKLLKHLIGTAVLLKLSPQIEC